MTNHECPLSARPLDWPSATDEELLEALKADRLLNPHFIAYIVHGRPRVMIRRLREHEQSGGVLGKPAKRWLGKER